MNSISLEQEIIEQVRQLDTESQKRVLEFIHSLIQPIGDWVEQVHALRVELQTKYGEDFVFDSQATLVEIREGNPVHS
jgi:hypothetical protein